MDRLEGRSRDSFLDKAISRIIRARSTERDETEKREPHKITTPFLLTSSHTHQNPDTATKSPATFLTCATEKGEGTAGELMGIKLEKKERKETNKCGLYVPVKTQQRQIIKEKRMPKK